ncbi:30S ribosomal protein S16 [Acidobacteriota bacterium]
MIKIRLRRMGCKKKPHYRVVVSDSRYRPTGRFIETVGYYSPCAKPVELKLDKDKIQNWIKQGAKPSETVKHLLEKS